MITQAMGLRLATPHEWRIVLLFSSALSVAQLLLSSAIVESPTWLHRHGLLQEKAAASRKLWTVGEAPRRCKYPVLLLLIVTNNMHAIIKCQIPWTAKTPYWLT